MKKLVQTRLGVNLICSVHQPRAEKYIKWFKERISLALWNNNELSYRSYKMLIKKVTASMNQNVEKISFDKQDSTLNMLFSLPNAKSTFLAGERVYKLYSAFQRKSLLNFKYSIRLGDYVNPGLYICGGGGVLLRLLY